jgi:hypothetical protein
MRLSRYIVLALLLSAIPATIPTAQGQTALDRVREARERVQMTGSVGMMMEANATTADQRRRDPFRSQITANAGASGFGFSYGLSMLLTLQQVELQQRTSTPLSRVGLSAQRGWAAVAVGDVSPTFSRYSLNGVLARGGFFELTPGDALVSFVGGRSREAGQPTLENLLREPTYEQFLWGGRVGYGQEGRTYARASVLYVRDAASSIDAPPVSASGSPTVLPGENVSVTGQGGWLGFGGALRLEGELTASGVTRDVRGARLEGDGPGFPFGALLDARAGSRVDYAGQASAQLSLPLGRLRASYERVAPGFESFGVAQQRADQEIIRLRPSLRLREGRLTLGADLQQRRNNLAETLDATLRRRQAGLTAQWRPSAMLSLSGGYTVLDNESIPTAAPGTQAAQYDTRQRSQTLTLAPLFVLPRGATVHTLGLTGFYQVLTQRGAAFEQGLVARSGFTNTTGTGTYTLTLPSGLSFNASLSGLRSRTPGTTLTSAALQLGAGLSPFPRMRLNASAGYSRNSAEADMTPVTVGQQANVTGTATLRVMERGTLALNLRGLRSASTGAPSFTEGQATLRYEHRL